MEDSSSECLRAQVNTSVYLFIQPRYTEMTLTQKVASCLISNIAMSHGGLIIGMFEGTGKYFCLFIKPRYAEMTLTQKVASCLISNIAMSHGGLVIGMFEGTGKYFWLSIYPATLCWDDLDPEGGILSDIQHRHVTWRSHHRNCYSLWVRGLFTFLKYGIVMVILLTKLISSRNHRTAACSSYTCVPLH